ncbi:YlzJ-like family protein [Pontibacillus marinus]|uniref:Uncharacterized protein n=1 Tax=Pontibacillus marinus BH030004 = DSM 16465 TaxID=1385511 RepID=A0A0A5FXB8_9BACI|nr:YlzJ-like family protein [Pontibacillus marinus]KGX83430.1 hypothetical protein N783_03660 [Pontibacillus marinus BH030004 = DSM 16465]
MIHYTPLSEHDIYEDDPKSYEKQRIVSVNGKSMKVYDNDDGTVQLVQLLSTDPQDYLDQNFIPGNTFSVTDVEM